MEIISTSKRKLDMNGRPHPKPTESELAFQQNPSEAAAHAY